MEKLSIAKQKWIRSLHHKKYREKYGYFIGEGDKLFNELGTDPQWTPFIIAASELWWSAHPEALNVYHDMAFMVEAQDLKNISALTTPQEPLMVLERPALAENLPAPEDQNLLLYLDGIRDPGNLGTILRIADWFGHGTVLASEDTVDWSNPKTIQATMGSFLRVRVIQKDLGSFTGSGLENWKIMAAAMEGRDIHTVDPGNAILVIGNESHGVRDEVAELVSEWIHIPGRGGAESLNAAIATAICCYQFYGPEKK